MDAEQLRLQQINTGKERWDQFGPYLSERAWATVREDYSPYGTAWDYFPHDHARSRAYRWGEDGIGGISDDKQYICLALALWNGQDPILKERMFGLTGEEGNHGEDVKEYYFYLDSTPTHSYMQMLYKYPQAAFPYTQLIQENRRRGKNDDEYELVDTGIFNENRYFDVFIEYAKADPDDILMRVRAVNRGPEAAALHLLPTLWFRNVWAWGNGTYCPTLAKLDGVTPAAAVVKAQHQMIGEFYFYCDQNPELLFTENETNSMRLWGVPSACRYVKDGINDRVVSGNREAVNPEPAGTKVAAYYSQTVAPGEAATLRLRLTRVGLALSPYYHPLNPRHLYSPVENPAESKDPNPAPFADFDAVFAERQREADEYFAALQPANLGEDERRVQRQALAGMLWSKQFYYYVVEQWLNGDPTQPIPPTQRKQGRNREWQHLFNERVMSMPDKWEYPWYAAWDLAFHTIPLALMDSHFAKSQLDLLLREWYQHPNGAVPAYEWAFSDVNPPVMAWAAWRIYKMELRQSGQADRYFLETVFHKLMLNFNWWVNRKDSSGNNVFEGGFLGLDNIGVFDRSAPLPQGGYLEQSDGTSWMGMFCLNMMTIALELSRHNHAYENIATKFFEHFLAIAKAMNHVGDDDISLWDEQDEFFYDVLQLPQSGSTRIKVRSLVGLIPLLAVETVEPDLLEKLPGFRMRLEWYLNYRPELAALVARWQDPGAGERRLLALVRGHRMKSLLKRLLDPNEFLSEYGVRSISKYHESHPYELNMDGTSYQVKYEPGESRSGLFGGNSNWRGPVWFPINYLLIEALQKFHHYYGDDFKVECPTGSGQYLTLDGVANELSRRLIALFTRNADGQRPFNGHNAYFQNDPHWRDLILFYEYFHGDDGRGIGASHQTGWTGLVAKLIQQQSQKGEGD